MRLPILILAAIIGFATPAAMQAQVPNGYGNGDLRAPVQAQWEQLPTAEIACIDRRLNRRGRSINAIIGQGIGPGDDRLTDIRRACRDAAGASAVVGAGPSFDCRRARSDDEIAICGNSELSRLDRAIGDGFSFLSGRYGRRTARRITDPMLRQRGDCGDDVACIKQVQSATIGLLQSRGAPIQMEEAVPVGPADKATNAPGDRQPQAPQPAPQSAPAAQAEQTPPPSQPSPPASTPAAAPKPAATPPVAAEPAPAPRAAAPAALPAKPAEAPIRDVGSPAITAAPAASAVPTTAMPNSSSLTNLLVAIIVVQFGVIGLLLLRQRRARPAIAMAPATDSKPAGEAVIPQGKPAGDAIILPVQAIPAAAASPSVAEPVMDLASLAPADKPLDHAAPAAAPPVPVPAATEAPTSAEVPLPEKPAVS